MKINRPFLIFYIVFIYILAFAIWWSVLLLRTTNKEYGYLKKLIALNAQSDHPDDAVPTLEELETDIYRQKFMVISEGIAFVILLLVGLMRARKAFIKEIDLAHRQRNFTLFFWWNPDTIIRY